MPFRLTVPSAPDLSREPHDLGLVGAIGIAPSQREPAREHAQERGHAQPEQREPDREDVARKTRVLGVLHPSLVAERQV